MIGLLFTPTQLCLFLSAQKANCWSSEIYNIVPLSIVFCFWAWKHYNPFPVLVQIISFHVNYVVTPFKYIYFYTIKPFNNHHFTRGRCWRPVYGHSSVLILQAGHLNVPAILVLFYLYHSSPRLPGWGFLNQVVTYWQHSLKTLCSFPQ